MAKVGWFSGLDDKNGIYYPSLSLPAQEVALPIKFGTIEECDMFIDKNLIGLGRLVHEEGVIPIDIHQLLL
jgi:hypothetical protein